MSLDPLTPLPTPPSRNMDAPTFNAAADAWVAAEANLAGEFNDRLAKIPEEVNPANLNATSATSLAIGTGTKSLTVQTAKLFVAGQWLIAASTASPTNFMIGQVTSYNGATGALALNISTISGAGTFAAWTIGPVAAPPTNLAPRVITAGAASGSIAPDAVNADLFVITGLTAAATIAAPTGTPAAGQKLMLRIKDNGTARALTWNAIYKPYGAVVLPTATTAGKSIYVGLIYESVSATWSVIALAVEQ